jgi:hypothetical protein
MGRSGAVVATLLAVMMVTIALPSLVGSAEGATPATLPSGNSSQWAYGAAENISTTVTTNHTTYAVTGWFAYHVVLTQVNISASVVELEVERTAGFAFNATYCSPSCGTHARVSVIITSRGWTHDAGFANLTSAGAVEVGARSVPAIALLNSSTESSSGLSTVVAWSLNTLTRQGSGGSSLHVNLTGQTTVSFSPALGLIPANLSAGEQWSSSSGFTALGAAKGEVVYSRTTINGVTLPGSFDLNVSAQRSGSVSLTGQDRQTITLRDGRVVPVLVFTVVGPFETREGIIWVPTGADLFGSGAAAFSQQSPGSVGVTTSAVDWASGNGPAGLLASATGFSPSPDATSSLGTSPDSYASSSAAGVSSLATPANPTIAVQGQPESVPTAEAGSQCVQGGSGWCGGPVPGGAGPTSSHGLFGLLVVGGVVVVLAGLLAGLVVTRRREPKPPTGALAAYPQSGTSGLARAPPRTGPGSSPGDPEHDPLGHLW